MKTKDAIKKILNDNFGNFVSGEEIASRLYVSRAAVWKAIKALTDEGLQIEAVTNKGYRLKSDLLLPDCDIIQKKCESSFHPFSVIHKPVVDSTNDEALRIYKSPDRQEKKDNILVIADAQTNGRGRRGRSFYSPEGCGLYMTLLFHPKIDINSLTTLTALAAVSVFNALSGIECAGTLKPAIKWVNDIYLDDKKVAGILSEAIVNMEAPEETIVLIGFGINLFSPKNGYPKPLKNIAGAVFDNVTPLSKTTLKDDLITGIISNLSYFTDPANAGEAIGIYRDNSNILGKYVKINSFDNAAREKYGYVTGITDDYKLEIKYETGETEILSSGEISAVRY
ncbi:MAG: biotin--[acetyl-CoA-carboxylase] ligase [Acetatifactor sp.]|nr:biotin--[acetyl-CoA-carboxylase] ligase [Acetatifactor sp.]